MKDDTEHAIYTRSRRPDFGLFADAASEPTERHVAAIASVEASGLPGETALVESIQAMLRERYTFSADDVRALLGSAGVPDTLEVRRRYSSRIISGGRGKGWWVPDGKKMTADKARSGREITIWRVVKDAAK